MTALTVDPGWLVVPVAGGVALTAGGHVVYRLPDLPTAEAAFLMAWFCPQTTVGRVDLPRGWA